MQDHLGTAGRPSPIDRLLFRVSVFVVPVAIALVSLLALFVWDEHYRSASGTPLELRAIGTAGDDPIAPGEARQRLDAVPKSSYRDTKLSEAPFWIAFDVPAVADGASPSIIELPSRHAVRVACWAAPGLAPLGAAARDGGRSGVVRPANAGFVIELDAPRPAGEILCRIESQGPARISALRSTMTTFHAAQQQFHRNAGLLEGGFTILALFVITAALINRELMYVLFAAWLIANLRLAALSAGWDIYWNGSEVPWEWVIPMRKVSMAAYYLLTITLFARLCREDLRKLGQPVVFRIVQWSCLPVVGAVVLPYGQFLPLLWVATTLSILVLLSLLVWIAVTNRSRVAMWYSASLGIALFASLYEVVAAALGIKDLIGSVNSVTAALASSLMAAFAIAEQIRVERQERVQAQTALRNAYEAIPIGLFTLDAEGRFIQANPTLREMLGMGRMAQQRWQDFFEPGAWYRLQELLSVGKQHEIELQSIAVPGREPKWFLVRAALSREMVEGSLQDITERVKATEKLTFFAEHDPLTGILNRRGIERILDRTIPRQDPRDGAFCLAYLDLDRFKLINDLFGHTAGDTVLRQVCERVREVLSERQEIGRVGGDEFVIVFPDTSIKKATWICREIVERIGSVPYQIGDRAFQVKCSIGLIEVGGQINVQNVISVADRACHEAKRGHHGNPVVYEKHAKVFGEREEELRLVKRFGSNVAPEGLLLAMQPIMSMREPYKSLNLEVLLRMRDADGSLVPAGRIIPAAESNGRISVIDRWVLATTLSWLAEHQEHLKTTRFVCVNLSGGSLNDERFVADAFAMLGEFGRVVERLCIEITESVALHDLANTRRFIDRVRGFGAKVALDDFGAGYTSFSYLKELPADALKIDGSFVRGVNAQPANLAIVEAIVALARNLGMQSIAEWVENAPTLEALAQVGVDHVQGFAIARPRDPADILAAGSAAGFIDDERVAAFVRGTLAAPGSLDLWDDYAPPRMRLH